MIIKGSSRIINFLILMLFSVGAFSGQIFGPYNSVEILSVKDGDTISAMVAVWPDTYVQVDVRIRGIDAPEIRNGKRNGKTIPQCEISRGNGATSYASDIISQAESIILFNVDPSATKYAGRISGDFLIGGDKFSDLMIQAGHAIKYEGGTRDIWPCQE